MIKTVRTPTYKYNFDVETGYFQRWGKTVNDDPQYSPIGNEILDIEVSTVCHKGCKFCYKGNTAKGQNMSFDTFKIIFDKMPTLTQIAFGIGDLDGNPDLWKMFEYCRENKVVPNVTINGEGLDRNKAFFLHKFCGAVAVSNYDKDSCYNAVKMLTDEGMDQINIHQLLSQESFEQAKEVVQDSKNDPRLAKLNAIVFLSLKQKGRGINHHILDFKSFDEFMRELLQNNVRFGMDSCSATKFLKVIQNHPRKEEIEEMIEPCESTAFSFYIDVEGNGYPCSFTQGTPGWEKGISVVDAQDFLQDIWFDPRIVEWRKKLLSCKRSCPIYNV
jgi:MoaA/NifB/PqqE/SkfB family radical SAM enzyme